MLILIVKIYLPEIDGSSISRNNPKIISFTNILMLMVDPFTCIVNVEYTSNYNGAATRENRSSGFPTRSDTNRPVQSQKMARSLKFRI